MTKLLRLALIQIIFFMIVPHSSAEPKVKQKSKIAKKKTADIELDLVLKEAKSPGKGIHRFVCSLKNRAKRSDKLVLTTTHLPLVTFTLFSSEPKGKKEIQGEVNPPFLTAGSVSPTLWGTFTIASKKSQEVASLDIDLKKLTAGSSLNTWQLSSFKKRTIFIRAIYSVTDDVAESFKKANGKTVPVVALKSGELKIRLK